MITVGFSKDNLPERKYIIDVVFGQFLGIDYQILPEENTKHWSITLSNGSSLIFKDDFFSQHTDELSYLSESHLPQKIDYTVNQFLVEKDIPVLFGEKGCRISENQIECDIDIFASSFFMLTRWEEYANKKRDSHDRFSAKDSIAYKNNFLHRPVVNEYVEMLKNMLASLDSEMAFEKRNFELIVSCDVDQPFDCTVESFASLLRACAGDLIKRHSINEFLKRIRRYFYNKIEDYKYDDCYTFDWYMDLCESEGIKASFYFIPSSVEKMNGCYNLKDKKIQKLLKYIDERDHEIGVHGSYQTYRDKKKTAYQKSLFDDCLKKLNISQKALGNRQHYLRWDSSVTPQNLENAGFAYDTTGSYGDRPGFRYGCCYEFSMFDFLNRKRLSLKQRPLIVMECSVIAEAYMGLGYTQESLDVIMFLKKQCERYRGDFTLLWHNDSLMDYREKRMFEKILQL